MGTQGPPVRVDVQSMLLFSCRRTEWRVTAHVWLSLSSQALSNVPLAGASISVPAMVERVFPISTALGVGLSYGGEAVGTAVSPIMLPWTGSNVRRMRAALGLSFLIGGVGFALDVVAPYGIVVDGSMP